MSTSEICFGTRVNLKGRTERTFHIGTRSLFSKRQKYVCICVRYKNEDPFNCSSILKPLFSQQEYSNSLRCTNTVKAKNRFSVSFIIIIPSFHVATNKNTDRHTKPTKENNKHDICTMLTKATEQSKRIGTNTQISCVCVCVRFALKYHRIISRHSTDNLAMTLSMHMYVCVLFET